MAVFRATIISMWVALLVYTAIVISNHGMGLFQIFFGDIAAMNWAGQFNVDFLGFLVLSALWVAWRDKFGTTGLLLMPVAFLGGIGFLGVYLTLLSLQHDTIGSLLLGKQSPTL